MTDAGEAARRILEAARVLASEVHPSTERNIARALLSSSKRIEELERERDGEREAREKCERALAGKDAAMGVLFERLEKAGVDCSDLFS